MTVNMDTQFLPTPTASPPPFDMVPIETKTKQLNDKPPVITTLSKFLKELDGRDKAIKIIQYLFKILLHHKFVSPKRWSAMVSHFSMTRKILRLGHALGPAQELLSQQQQQQQQQKKQRSFWETLFLLNELSNDVADDIYCLFKLGLVGPRLGKRAEVVAYYCWFAAILHDLRTQLITLRRISSTKNNDPEKRWMTQVTIAKLTMDGIFCACDIWQPSFSNGVQAWSGFWSGVLSGYKLWRKCAS